MNPLFKKKGFWLFTYIKFKWNSQFFDPFFIAQLHTFMEKKYPQKCRETT